MRRRSPALPGALLTALAACAIGAVTTPIRVEALIDCDDPALKKLVLPDPNDPNNPGAAGWTRKTALKGTPPNPIGSVPELASGDQSAGVAKGTAQLFTQQVGGVKCFYLRRQIDGATANG